MSGVNTIPNTFRIQYQDEFKMDFDRTQATLRKTVNSNGTVMGSEIRFDRVDPAGQANTRTRDSRIPVSQLGLTQIAATIREDFLKFRSDSFDLVRGNPNIKTAQYRRAIGAVNKAIDAEIIRALDATSVQVSGSGAALSTMAAIDDWVTRLYENDVEPGNIWGVVTPKAIAQIKRINQLTSKDFMTESIIVNGVPNPISYWYANGVKWIMHNGLTGRQTNNAQCYLYDGNALGHAIDGDPASWVFYDDTEDQYGQIARARHAAVAVLTRGIVRFRHDDTAGLS